MDEIIKKLQELGYTKPTTVQDLISNNEIFLKVIVEVIDKK